MSLLCDSRVKSVFVNSSKVHSFNSTLLPVTGYNHQLFRVSMPCLATTKLLWFILFQSHLCINEFGSLILLVCSGRDCEQMTNTA